MEYQFSFTAGELVAWVLALCAGIVTITRAVDVVIDWVKRAKKPELDQNTRLDALEERIKKLERIEDNDQKHLDELDEGNRVTQQALLALLGHAIDGNNQTQLENARNDLHKYLVSR